MRNTPKELNELEKSLSEIVLESGPICRESLMSSVTELFQSGELFRLGEDTTIDRQVDSLSAKFMHRIPGSPTRLKTFLEDDDSGKSIKSGAFDECPDRGSSQSLCFDLVSSVSPMSSRSFGDSLSTVSPDYYVNPRFIRKFQAMNGSSMNATLVDVSPKAVANPPRMPARGRPPVQWTISGQQI